MHGITERSEGLVNVEISVVSVICDEKGIFRVGTREVMVDNRPRMIGGKRTDQEDLIPFMMEIESQSNPEVTGSLNGKISCIRVAIREDV